MSEKANHSLSTLSLSLEGTNTCGTAEEDKSQAGSSRNCIQAASLSASKAGNASFPDGTAFLFPFKGTNKSLFSPFGSRMLAAGLVWTKADPGLSLRAQADAGLFLHLPENNLPDHGLVIEERAGFASLYAGHDSPKDSKKNRQKDSHKDNPDASTDASPDASTEGSPGDSLTLRKEACSQVPLSPFCKVYSLAALRLQGLRHGIEIWPLTYSTTDGITDGITGGQQATVYWVYAARLGRLSARADQCFATREEALALASRLRESLDIQSIRELSLEEAAEELEKLSKADAAMLARARLRPLSLKSALRIIPGHNKSLCKVLAVILWAGLVLTACYVLQDPITARISQGRSAPAVQTEQKADTESAAYIMLHPERYFPSKWLTAPSPAASVLAMVPDMLETPLAANGWTLEELSCSQGTLTASWKAARASSLLLPPKGAERLASDVTRARSMSETRSAAASARQWRELYTKNELQAVLSELAARFGLKMELAWQPVKTIKKDDVVISCPWAAGRLALTQAPGTLFYDFASLATCLTEPGLATGLVLSSITWNKKQWSIQGEVYAKP